MFRPTSPRLFVLAAVVLLVSVVLIGVALVQHRPSSGPRMLEIELIPKAGTAAQVYWSPGQAFSEEQSVRIPFTPASNSAQLLRFPLPETPVAWLRIDPTDAAGEVLIGAARVVDSRGRAEGTLNPDDFAPAAGIASITRIGDVTRIVTAPDANDPALIASFGCVERAAPADQLTRVTPASLAVVSTAVVVLLVVCAALLARTIRQRLTGRTRWAVVAALAGLFLIIFGAKLSLMHQNPLTVPYWDQWDGEARSLYVPFNQCTLSWAQMFGLHNEHRIFFSRLLALDLLLINGQWDPRLQQVVNGAMHALIGVLLAAIVCAGNAKQRIALLAIIGMCAVVFASPFAWDNTLMGFQSAFYFLLLFSVLALWLTTSYRAGTWPWILGCVCALCALFTSAGGVITIAAILGVATLTFVSERRDWRGFLLALTCSAAMLWLGIKALSPPIPGHEFLRAHTAAEFLGAFAHNLSWPWLTTPKFALLVWLPVAVSLCGAVWRRGRTTELERMNAGLSVWVVINAAAIAYGRGANAAIPATRYMDFLSLGLICNAVALAALVDRIDMRTMRRLAMGGAAMWLVFAIVGVQRLTRDTMDDLVIWRKHFVDHETNVHRYVLTGDFARLANKRGPEQIPYPEPYGLASALQDPYIRRILPAAVRPPLHVEPRAAATSGFVTGGRAARAIPRDPLQRYWWSLTDEGRKGVGRFESEPLRCQTGARLRFEVSGYLGWEGNSLALNVRSGEDVQVRPAQVARENWSDVLVACPSGLFAISAVDQTPESWFGFREPIEVGWGSVAAEWLIDLVP